MRYLLLSDVHANLEALEAVLKHAAANTYDRVICSGDIVGYGANAAECIDLLRDVDARCVAGNHESMVLGRLTFARCNADGIRAAKWTRKHLSRRYLDWLAQLPAHLLEDQLFVTHGSLHSNEDYLASQSTARQALQQLRAFMPHRRVLVCGHTHHQVFYCEGGRWHRPHKPMTAFIVPPETYCLINPGAVGQSRDKHAEARYAVYDSASGVIEFFSLPYNVRKTQWKLKQAGLTTQLSSARGRPWNALRERVSRLVRQEWQLSEYR